MKKERTKFGPQKGVAVTNAIPVTGGHSMFAGHLPALDKEELPEQLKSRSKRKGREVDELLKNP